MPFFYCIVNFGKIENNLNKNLIKHLKSKKKKGLKSKKAVGIDEIQAELWKESGKSFFNSLRKY